MNARMMVAVLTAFCGSAMTYPTSAGLRQDDDYPKSVSVQRAETVETFKTKRADIITKVQGVELPVRLPVPSFVKVYEADCETLGGDHLCDIRANVNTNDVDRCIAYYDGVFWDHKWARYVTDGPDMHSLHLPTRFAEHPAAGEAQYAFYAFSGGKFPTISGKLMINRLTRDNKGISQQFRIFLTWPADAK